MALKNLIFIVATAVFLQSVLADPVLIRTWDSDDTNAEENEILKNVRQEIDEFSEDPVEVDVVEVDRETVPMPDLGSSLGMSFIHDYTTNKTVIVDFEDERCFVMDLDYDRYAPPTSLFDMFWKLSTDHFAVDTDLVRLRMRVVLPPIDNLQDLGEGTQLHCMTFHTYMLVKAEREYIFKRSIAQETPTFREKIGGTTFEFSIVNMGEVSEYEKHI